MKLGNLSKMTYLVDRPRLSIGLPITSRLFLANLLPPGALSFCEFICESLKHTMSCFSSMAGAIGMFTIAASLVKIAVVTLHKSHLDLHSRARKKSPLPSFLYLNGFSESGL